MRKIILILLGIVVSCDGPRGPQGPKGSSGKPGMNATVSTVEFKTLFTCNMLTEDLYGKRVKKDKINIYDNSMCAAPKSDDIKSDKVLWPDVTSPTMLVYGGGSESSFVKVVEFNGE